MKYENQDYESTWGKLIELLETISMQLECLNNRVDMMIEEPEHG